jgi:hypothetical protein
LLAQAAGQLVRNPVVASADAAGDHDDAGRNAFPIRRLSLRHGLPLGAQAILRVAAITALPAHMSTM